jgi:hypothetical protein
MTLFLAAHVLLEFSISLCRVFGWLRRFGSQRQTFTIVKAHIEVGRSCVQSAVGDQSATGCINVYTVSAVVIGYTLSRLEVVVVLSTTLFLGKAEMRGFHFFD